jgi:hypothetical protein
MSKDEIKLEYYRVCDGICKVEATINAKEQCIRCGMIHKE